MRIARFSIVLGAALAVNAAAAAPSSPPELRADPIAGIVVAQTFKERELEDMPAVDAGRTQPPRPPALTKRAPTASDDEIGPPVREVPPPPPASASRNPDVQPPPPPHEPPPPHRTEPPAYDDPPPPRRANVRRRAPPAGSASFAKCTQQCHLSCEASFEACNGDASPANPACVKQLESCRVERCSCRMD